MNKKQLTMMVLTALALSACGGKSSSSSSTSAGTSSSSNSSSSISSSSSVSSPSGGSILNSSGTFLAGQEGFTTQFYDGALASVSWDGEVSITINQVSSEVWHVQLLHDLSIQAGEQYTVCFDAKASASRSITVNIDSSEPDYTSLVGGGDTGFLGTAYESYQFTFYADGTDATARLVLNMGLTDEDVQLDNVGVYQGGQCGNSVPSSSMSSTSSNSSSSATGNSSGFYVSGRNLYDHCGEQVVLRGVNEMVVWTPGKDGLPEFDEIAKTGANAVRIVWTSDGSATELDRAIQNAIDRQMIPLIENHEATGDLSALPAVVDWWVQPDIVSVIKKHEQYLLVNIANESGDTSVNTNTFVNAYKSAITRMRNAGISTPLVIDASSWGQDIDILQASGPQLIAHDPLSNLVFSVHMWWSDPNGDRVRSELQQSVNQSLPLIVGEFAQHAVYMCAGAPFDYSTLLTEAEKHSIGWLAWSWGGVDNQDCADQGSFDMTIGGAYGNWEETWGEVVSVSHPASIMNSSKRPYSITNGSCR